LTRLLKTIALAGLVAAALGVSAGSAPAATPCWKTVINDWYDGHIDHRYPITCYRQALSHLPEDVSTYSSARDDITQAMQLAIAGKGPKGGKPSGPRGNGAVRTALKDIGPKSADSFPVPLIVLGAIALLLIAAGSAGYLARRMHARRVGISPSPSLPNPPQQ
jgi:hypothetical protein